MDSWGRKHLAKWLADELPIDALNDSDLEERMIEVYERDSEFWGNQSYWNLLDATVREYTYLQASVLGSCD